MPLGRLNHALQHGQRGGALLEIERLEQIFELLGKPARGKSCEAILGIIDEAKENMDDFKGTKALDPALVPNARNADPRILQFALKFMF